MTMIMHISNLFANWNDKLLVGVFVVLAMNGDPMLLLTFNTAIIALEMTSIR